jgi:hypothetical protein
MLGIRLPWDSSLVPSVYVEENSALKMKSREASETSYNLHRIP